MLDQLLMGCCGRLRIRSRGHGTESIARRSARTWRLPKMIAFSASRADSGHAFSAQVSRQEADERRNVSDDKRSLKRHNNAEYNISFTKINRRDETNARSGETFSFPRESGDSFLTLVIRQFFIVVFAAASPSLFLSRRLSPLFITAKLN